MLIRMSCLILASAFLTVTNTNAQKVNQKTTERIQKSYWPNKTLRQEGPFLNGRKHGFFKQYNQDGSLSREANYKNGKLHGLSKLYNKGQLSIEFNYQNNKRHGFFKLYNEDGSLSRKSYYKHGKLHGPFRGYNKGRLSFEINYRNNKKHGVVKHYNQDGSLSREAYYKNGKLHGLSKEYKKGRLSFESNYQNNKMHGISKFYHDETGKLVNISEYQDGKKIRDIMSFHKDGSLRKPTGQKHVDSKPDGTKTQHFDSGAVFSIRDYKNGMLHGRYLQYYENGKLDKEHHYRKGKRHGKQRGFYENGQLRTEIEYLNGTIKDGEYATYTPDGAVTFKTIYAKGKRVKERHFYSNGLLKSVNSFSAKNRKASIAFDKQGRVISEDSQNGRDQRSTWNSYYQGGGLKEKRSSVKGSLVIMSFDRKGKRLKETTDIHSIKPPIEVLNSASFLDGGTIGVSIKDASGRVLRFSLPENMIAELRSKGTNKKPRHISVGAEHHRLPGAIQLGLKSKEEKQLLKLLKQWLKETQASTKIRVAKKPDASSQDTSEMAKRAVEHVSYIIKVLEERN